MTFYDAPGQSRCACRLKKMGDSDYVGSPVAGVGCRVHVCQRRGAAGFQGGNHSALQHAQSIQQTRHRMSHTAR